MNADVPEISSDVYRDIAQWGASTPGWVHGVALVLTQAMLLVFVALTAVVWWRVRDGGLWRMLGAAVPLVAAGVAYGANDMVKDLVQEERPCRAVAHVGATIATCPAPGDWSFPSNHATIAAGFAVSLAIVWRRITALVVLVALLEGFSRVFVGVHYPHDVLVGYLVGAVVAALVTAALRAFLARREPEPVPASESPTMQIPRVEG
ncbi:phosphatase PAP2 family protein [Saccharopolyspora rosea]|uniref:Phosphatase PAP2 family protein n=1 Tax=Saccharopolyspora rosea TaxID=524884 RepID=A0ABW3FIN5_9PSEU|nr:phosphatase PAP2 family protein [Saccharopolyspora rosea]